MSRPHICFVAVHVYPTLVRSSDIEFVGGAEVQQAIQMRALQRAGYRVSVLVKDYGQAKLEMHEGIEIHRIPDSGRRGIRGTGFIYPRMTDVLGMLKRLSPDIVFVQTACEQVAAAALYARLFRKRFVYAGAADFDFLSGKLPLMPLRDTVLYRTGLRAAHGVIVQNLVQERTLKQNFGKDSVIIQNCYEEPEAQPGNPNGHILWAATVKPLKSPEKFIALARAIPSRKFVMVGGAGVTPDAKKYYEDMKAEATAVPNLEFLGYVPYAKVGSYFDGAALSVNTSPSEGLPNTFLQSWLRGIPTVSFVRPEAVPGQTGTIACDDMPQLISAVDQLTKNESAWLAASQRCRRYFGSHHTVDVALAQYQKFFDQVMA